MHLESPQSLAAELRARARSATLEERIDLLFLAAEYERLDGVRSCDIEQPSMNVFLPK